MCPRKSARQKLPAPREMTSPRSASIKNSQGIFTRRHRRGNRRQYEKPVVLGDGTRRCRAGCRSRWREQAHSERATLTVSAISQRGACSLHCRLSRALSGRRLLTMRSSREKRCACEEALPGSSFGFGLLSLCLLNLGKPGVRHEAPECLLARVRGEKR